MKIDKNYAYELLKECEEAFPQEITAYVYKEETKSSVYGKQAEFDRKKYAHLLYLLDEGVITDINPYNEPNHSSGYRINSDGLNLLSGQGFLEWMEKHRP